LIAKSQFFADALSKWTMQMMIKNAIDARERDYAILF